MIVCEIKNVTFEKVVNPVQPKQISLTEGIFSMVSTTCTFCTGNVKLDIKKQYVNTYFKKCVLQEVFIELLVQYYLVH